MQNADQETQLRKVLRPRHIWALAVGAVISGDYYGFSYGFETGGPPSLLVAFIPVMIMYILFVFSYIELAINVPSAGGASEYASRAMGRFAGFIAGISVLTAYIVAPVAVAITTGQLIHYLLPGVPSLPVTIAFFCAFVLINLLGTESSSTMELAATVAAIIGLVIFIIAAIPHFKASRFITEPAFTDGGRGIVRAIPFAMWFFFAVDSTIMQSEEMVDPVHELFKGYLPAIITLTITAISVILLPAGIADYHEVAKVDFPLTRALELAVEESPDISAVSSAMPKVIAVIALFSMVASFSAIVLSYSRQAFALSRSGYLPGFFTRLNKRGAPVYALLIPSAIGLILAVLGNTALMVTVSVFAALIMYLMVILSNLILHIREPEFFRFTLTGRERETTSRPVAAIAALILVSILMFLMIIFNFNVLKWVILLYALATAYYIIHR